MLEVGLDDIKDFIPNLFFSSRCLKLNIVVSLEIMSLIKSIPAKHIVAICIKASSLAGSLKLYQLYIR